MLSQSLYFKIKKSESTTFEKINYHFPTAKDIFFWKSINLKQHTFLSIWLQFYEHIALNEAV